MAACVVGATIHLARYDSMPLLCHARFLRLAVGSLLCFDSPPIPCLLHFMYLQLGDDALVNVLTPPGTDVLTDVVSIGTGEQHSCALLASSAVRCWGDNRLGQV